MPTTAYTLVSFKRRPLSNRVRFFTCDACGNERVSEFESDWR